MADDKNHVEANIARLVQAAFGGTARLDRASRERTWRCLIAELRVGRTPEFPDRALALLGLFLVGVGVWLAIRMAGIGAVGLVELPAVLAVPALGMNLALAPVAALVILLRRQQDARSA